MQLFCAVPVEAVLPGYVVFIGCCYLWAPLSPSFTVRESKGQQRLYDLYILCQE